MGKTRFMVEYALRHQEDYQALLFVPAEQPEALYQNLAILCGPLALNLPEQHDKEEATQLNAVLRWLQAHQGWFLMLDNVDTQEGAEAVEEFVGRLHGGGVLITTRLADWSAAIQTCELLELSEQASIEFLLERTRNKRRQRTSDEDDARSLAKELGYLAVALAQAGAFIAQKRSSLAEYLACWRQRDHIVQGWNDERLTKYPRAVVTAWDTTVNQLSSDARTLLQQLSWLAPEPIPREIITEGSAQDALAELVSFSLAAMDVDGRQFRVHRLVQDVTRARQDEEQKTNSLKTALEMVSNAIPDDPQDVRTWPRWEPLRFHVAVVAEHADRQSIVDPTARLKNQLALLLLAKAIHNEAEPLMRRALAIGEASYGPEQPNVAIHLGNLAQLLQDTNRLAETEPLMKRALYIYVVFARSTGHAHPHPSAMFGNYVQLLQARAYGNEKIVQELFVLGAESCGSLVGSHER